MNEWNFKLQKGCLQQRRTLLQQLVDYSDLMEEAIKKEDLELYEKMEREFICIVEQLEFVGKRYK
ncbi:hypothetical protein GC101_28485 [Paenibacillus sp. LMG 31459]|uniref:IDEAL domain-containing protein n=1 Tax=Paenibacillus phytohabitans TaxID=2654978 RepID=A0ABX1YRU9_9BACL|nr:hypothetical protein [Paenibacillus phytohabitans]NOU82806.1 hypothetical protein [Paenibacillus phytohabitans]